MILLNLFYFFPRLFLRNNEFRCSSHPIRASCRALVPQFVSLSRRQLVRASSPTDFRNPSFDSARQLPDDVDDEQRSAQQSHHQA